MLLKIDPASIIIIASYVVIGAAQILLCIKLKNIFIRLIPTVFSIISTAVLFVLTVTSQNWDAIGYLILTLFSAGLIALCASIWIIYGIVCLIRMHIKKSSAEQAESIEATPENDQTTEEQN